MQYVRSLGGSVSKTWNSINPATLSGAIDVIVVEQEDGIPPTQDSNLVANRLQAHLPARRFTFDSGNSPCCGLTRKRYDTPLGSSDSAHNDVLGGIHGQ